MTVQTEDEDKGMPLESKESRHDHQPEQSSR